MGILFFGGLEDLVLRAALFVVGMAVAVHFTLMACASDGRTLPWADAFLMAFTATSGFAAALYALGADHHDTLVAVVIMAGLLVAFLIRLWWLGFQASVFYKKRGQRS